VTTLDQVLEVLLDTNRLLDALPQRLLIAAGQIRVGGLSDIDANLGLVTAGEFRAGNGRGPGTGFSGVRIAWPGMTYNSALWHIAGVSADVLQFGLRATDGVAVFGAGVVTMDVGGITVTDQGGGSYVRFEDTAGDLIADLIGLQSGSLNSLYIRTWTDGTDLANLVLQARNTGVNFTTANVTIKRDAISALLVTGGGSSSEDTPLLLSGATRKILFSGIVATGSGNRTASTESIHFDVDLSQTFTWATGALATQRAAVFRAPTYAFAGASTITAAATLAITAAPIAGSNATIVSAFALWVQSGDTLLDGNVTVGSGGGTDALLTVNKQTSGTNDVRTLLLLNRFSSGSPAAGLGGQVSFQVETTVQLQRVAEIQGLWATATDASRKGRVVFNVYDTAAREALRLEASGAAAMLSFFGAAASLQSPGSDMNNNVTVGGTTDQIDNFTSLTTYSTDAAAIRNDIYQLARKVKLINDALRGYGLMS